MVLPILAFVFGIYAFTAYHTYKMSVNMTREDIDKYYIPTVFFSMLALILFSYLAGMCLLSYIFGGEFTWNGDI